MASLWRVLSLKMVQGPQIIADRRTFFLYKVDIKLVEQVQDKHLKVRVQEKEFKIYPSLRRKLPSISRFSIKKSLYNMESSMEASN